MRPLIKHLPLLLTLLVPLAVLAWLGSREMTRLTELSQTILQDEARRFLRTEEKKVREAIETQAHKWLHGKLRDLLTSDTVSLVEASLEIGKEPFVLQAFIADEDFALIAPRPPQVRSPSAPLSTFPTSQDGEKRELLLAELLRDMGDTEGAVETYQSYIDKYAADSASRTEGLTWALFHLAALLYQSGDGTEARSNYYLASLKADETCERRPTEDAAAVLLLSELSQAKINLDLGEMFALLESICTGQFEFIDYVATDLLDWVVADIVALIPPNEENDARRDRALALNRVRGQGRRFALEYDTRVRRRLRFEQTTGRKYEHQGVIFHTLSTAAGSSLLAMRPAWLNESNRHDGAAWIGLRLDLPALVTDSLSGNPTSVPGNIALAVDDASGAPLLANPLAAPLTKEIRMEFAPVVSRTAGLEFIAIPITDPSRIQSAERNLAILGLILVVVALGGAFLLIRSVRRETQLAQMKVQLLSRVTHELKTPLAVIKMYGETLGLGRTKDQEQVGKFAGIISYEADRLTSMIERILDFSKMEAGTFSYDTERIDLGELVEAVTEEYLPHIESHGVCLSDDIRPGLLVDVDPRAMASSIVNLLENAVKYTPSDAPDRSVDVQLTGTNGSAVLEVRDRGLGIPAGELDKVFGDFYRASNAGEVRGVGLGLSLVDHFARSHRGRIEALPRPDGGTIMRLTLPLAETGPPAPAAPVTQPRTAFTPATGSTPDTGPTQAP